jgi:hypothetical protein
MPAAELIHQQPNLSVDMAEIICQALATLLLRRFFSSREAVPLF